MHIAPHRTGAVGLPVIEDTLAGVAAAVSGGFDAAAMGDVQKDSRATRHLRAFPDLPDIA